MARRIIYALLAIFVVTGVSAQVSFNGGASTLKGFSPGRAFGGFHLGIEIPRDDAITYFARYTHCFANHELDSTFVYLSPRDINSLPPGSQIYPAIGATPTMNYNIIEGGTRYYLGDGYDFGFGAYGGSTILLVFNKVKMDYAPYNEDLYQVDPNYNYEGSIFSFGFGLMGGVKYTTLPFGTVYLDAGISYMLLALPSTAAVYPNMYNGLFFSFNLGYRKDLFQL